MLEFNKLFELLEDREIKLGEILDASPFDPNRHLGGKLKEEEFYECLMVHKEQFDELAKKLISVLESDIHITRVISLSGFSGVGKTTFLRYFKRYHSEYQIEMLDFFDLHHGLNKFASEAQKRTRVGQAIEMITKIADNAKNQGYSIKQDSTEIISLLEWERDAANPIVCAIKTYLARPELKQALNEIFHRLHAAPLTVGVKCP